MPKKKPPNKVFAYARELIPEGLVEFINYQLVFPVGNVLRGGISYLHNAPKILTRDELYERGLRMLKTGRSHIVAVNTVGKEDPQNYILNENNEYEKEYFEQLFRIVQKNRHKIGEALPVLRYMDLNDVQKCEEAISLLLYGSEVEIYESTIPIEFLIRDDKEVLLGFPQGNELRHGVQLINKDVCATLNKWIQSQTPTPIGAGFTDPQKIVTRIKDIRDTNSRHTTDDSLINAMNLLATMGIKDPFDATKKAFDRFINWYPNLYDEAGCESYYNHLANYIKDHTRSMPSFLDCGCAHGLGAKFLTLDGVEYWGVDASEELINIAKQRLQGVLSSSNLIASDIAKVLLEGKKGVQETQRLPKKFDVIACQGNTFDFFLGDLQKWFVLTLFKSRLREGGLLFLTQKSFTKGEEEVKRELPNNKGGVDTVTYRLGWKGDFLKLDVEFEGQSTRSVIQHPTNLQWLEVACRTLGFERMHNTESYWHNWFGPRGAAHPYDVYVFQLSREA